MFNTRMGLRNLSNRLGARLPRVIAAYGQSVIEACILTGKWLLRAHAAGLVGALALLIAAYVSIPSITDYCEAAYFVGDELTGGRTLGKLVLFGSICAIIVTEIEAIVRISRNFLRVWDGGSNIHQGEEFQGLNEASMALLAIFVFLVTSSSLVIFVELVRTIFWMPFFSTQALYDAWSNLGPPCYPRL